MMPTKNCDQCGCQFKGRKEKRFCSVACADASKRMDPEEVRNRRIAKARERSAEARREERRRAAEAKGKAYMTADEREAAIRSRRIARAQRAIDAQARVNAYQAFKWWLSRQSDDLRETFASADRKRNADEVRKRYAENPEHYRFMKKLHKHSNPDYVARYHKKRGERMKGQGDGTITRKALKAFLLEHERCRYCHGLVPLSDRSPDHFIPLAKGGAHSMSNIVMACIDCNTRKGAKMPHEFHNDVVMNAKAA